VTIGGLDGSKENLVQLYGDPMLERGFAVLAFDGPGQGECPSRALFTTPENHGTACVAIFDWLEQRPEIDMERVVLKGSSFGTYWTTVAGAMLGKRVAAIAAMSVCHEPGCHTIFNLAHPSYKQRFMFMSGHDDEQAFDAFVRGYDARPYAERVASPYLMMAGQNDELSPIRFTEELFTHVRAPKQLVIFERATHSPETGPGSAYTTVATTMMYDWLRDRVDGKELSSARIVVDAGGRASATPFPT
jgi:pimeloyl-ACP methyl ester carboxylesterase